MNDLSSESAPEPGTPPPLPKDAESAHQPPSSPTVARWRWWVHLIVLATYVLGIGLLGALEEPPAPEAEAPAASEATDPSGQPPAEKRAVALPADPVALIATTGIQLGIFGVFFGVAWLASRATRDDLLLRAQRPWWQTWLFGLGYSVAMRLILGIIVTVVLTVVAIWIMTSRGLEFTSAGFNEAATEVGQGLQPDMSHLVDIEALENSPLYLFLNATLISFVLAGFREELWRAGMLAGCRALFPQLHATRAGQIAFVVLVATVFGLGHLPQGLGGVFLTTLLGVLLGLIMIFHRSIWEATIAHGFFNALSFVGMHLLHRFKDQFPEIQKMLGGG